MATGTKQQVLNAFRHHRVLRQRGPDGEPLLDMCSTPFGIIGCYAFRRVV